MRSINFWLFISALILTIGLCSALKCYVCQGSSNDGFNQCGHGSDVDPDFLKDCDEELKGVAGVEKKNGSGGEIFATCRKIVTNVDFDVNTNKADERISRSCGWITSKYDDKCFYRGGIGGRQNVCSCTSHRCNGAIKTQNSFVFFSISAAIALMFKFYF